MLCASFCAVVWILEAARVFNRYENKTSHENTGNAGTIDTDRGKCGRDL